MSNTPNNHAAAISDDLILAAIQRAELHATNKEPGAAKWAIAHHLDIPTRSGRARHVRSRLGLLVEAGLLERSSRYGVQFWELTSKARRRLARLRRSGSMPELPESPQHKVWRNTRVLAENEIERLRQRLQDDLEEGIRMLEAGSAIPSDAWFELSETLQRAAWSVGSASHCLHEWVEPDDTKADIDDRDDPGDGKLDEAERARRRTRRFGRRQLQRWTSIWSSS